MSRVKEWDSWVLKSYFVFTLLFPAFYSPYTDVYLSAYYGGFSWAYLFLSLYMGIRIVKKWDQEKPWKKWLPYILLLAAYNLFSFYFNYKYLHWYWEQINNTVAFLLFPVLILFDAGMGEGKQDNIRFLIHCIVLSNAGSIFYYILGYTNLLICNNQFIFYKLPPYYYETRHYWIYSHKSEYALMLVAFIALFVSYRKKFKSRLSYGMSLLVLLVCLYLTHSWTGIVGVLLIFIGDILDRMDWKNFRLRRVHIFASGIFLIGSGIVAAKIFAERSVFTLGHRTEIWTAVAKVILKYPQGWGMRFGESLIQVTETRIANNAHNVFMNAALRFSIPAGICFTVLFIGIVVYSIRKSRSFLSAGMWLALLILLNMDYALMSLQMGLLFLIVYLVCFYKRKVTYVE